MYSPEKIESLNRARLALVMPALAEKCRQIIAVALAEGFTLIVTQGLRTFAEQDALFNKRPKVTNARGGQSFHNYGLAVDFGFIVNGEISWDEKLYKHIGRWAKSVEIEWGGNWKFTDLPHVQMIGGLTWQQCKKLSVDGKDLMNVWNRVMTPTIKGLFVGSDLSVKEFSKKYLVHAPFDSVKNILLVVVSRIAAAAVALWQIGLHGRVLVFVVAFAAIIPLVWAIVKYRRRLAGWGKDIVDSFLDK